ncbi:PHD finger protein ALFIN-LIKE 2-like [Phragmites australis]|uniref:PHD finger protein ALFIN-LIKE 2-like n=1 Tax=Phragmites australis TaxID=29695 RepID=UPI002D79CFE4|nr:PHD finger protein ALFIN-LIKE 2-like [Phragmites australis]
METAAPVSSAPRTVEDIYKDFNARRAGLVRALTSDVEEFYGLCDPEKENLCLYGLPNGGWEVALPAEEVPPELPEPAVGINFARDGMHRRDWLSLVAVHSDAWLFSVAFFFGARLNGNERKRLFSLINEHPSVYETMVERKQRENKSGVDNSGKSTKRANDGHTKNLRPTVVDDGFEDDEEHSETLCGTCSGRYNPTEFWIGCDICERWFHGKCVKITPAKAEHIKRYKCPDCSSKKSRQ